MSEHPLTEVAVLLARRRAYKVRDVGYLWEVIRDDGYVVYSGVTEAEARRAAASLNATDSAGVAGGRARLDHEHQFMPAMRPLDVCDCGVYRESTHVDDDGETPVRMIP